MNGARGQRHDLVLERQAVAAAVAATIADAGRGLGSVLFVVGEAGLGKTTVLDQARRAAADRFEIHLGQGDPVETTIPFGLLSQVVGANGDWRRLWRPGDDTLATVRARQFYSMLHWLEAASQPLLLALDDLHWADGDSLALLSFLCRRIRHLPVAVLVTLRPWPTSAHNLAHGLMQDGVARVERLAPLSRAAVTRLLSAWSGHEVQTEEADQAWRLCAGNPLLLRQFLEAIRLGEDLPVGHDQDRGRGVAAGGVRLALLLGRFAGVPGVAFRYAQAASVLGNRFYPALAAEVAALDEAEFQLALDALHRSGLVEPVADDPGRAPDLTRFAHPLFRQALHDDLSPAERSRLHRLAFRVALRHGIEPAEAAVHAVAGHMHGDHQAIATLERAGRLAMRQGAIETATTHFEHALELAGEGGYAGPALLDLGEMLIASGSPLRAVTLYERLLVSVDLDATTRADVLRMLGRALCANSAYRQAEACFVESADSAERAGDQARAVEALLDRASMWLLPPPSVLPSTVRARQLAARLDETIQTRAAMVWAFWSLLCGDPVGVGAAEQAAERALRHPAADLSWHPSTLGVYHNIARFTERFDECERIFKLMLAAAEEAGVPIAISAALMLQSDTLNRQGRLHESLELLERAAGMGSFLTPMAAGALMMGRACVLQLLGRRDEADLWWERSHRDAEARGEWPLLLWLWCIRGRQWLHDGRVKEAHELYQRLEAANQRFGLAEPCTVPWARDAIRAHLASGQIEDARRVLAWVEAHAVRLPCRWPHIVARAAQAALAERAGDLATAEAHHQAALALHGQVRLPLEHARTLIDYGAFLRRARAPAAARRPLAEALALAERADARWLADEACAELRVAGGRRRGGQLGRSGLTAQETRVAELAAGGARNAEISGQLVISQKTVETHLRHVFDKLGVGSRRELIRAWKASGGDELPAG